VVIGVLRAARPRLFRTAGLRLVEAALAKGGSFVEALGQLDQEFSDEAARLGCSPKFRLIPR